MKRLAIIPARAGSKGLADKNIRDLAGKPLILHSLEAARNSGLFHRILLSTDSQSYADMAEAAGFQVPFLRSPEASSDEATSFTVIDEVIENLKVMGESYDLFCLLQPTSPLRDEEDIKASWALFLEKEARQVVSLCPAEHSPALVNPLKEDGSLEGFLKPGVGRRQDLTPHFRLNGAIYWSYVADYLAGGSFFLKGSYAYIMPKERSVDIDDDLDFALAQVLMERKQR